VLGVWGRSPRPIPRGSRDPLSSDLSISHFDGALIGCAALSGGARSGLGIADGHLLWSRCALGAAVEALMDRATPFIARR